MVSKLTRKGGSRDLIGSKPSNSKLQRSSASRDLNAQADPELTSGRKKTVEELLSGLTGMLIGSMFGESPLSMDDAKSYGGQLVSAAIDDAAKSNKFSNIDRDAKQAIKDKLIGKATRITEGMISDLHEAEANIKENYGIRKNEPLHVANVRFTEEHDLPLTVELAQHSNFRINDNSIKKAITELLTDANNLIKEHLKGKTQEAEKEAAHTANKKGSSVLDISEQNVTNQLKPSPSPNKEGPELGGHRR